MTIKEAIKRLNLDVSMGFESDSKDLEDAIKLGIEALKHYQHERQRRGATNTMWLPGETKG